MHFCPRKNNNFIFYFFSEVKVIEIQLLCSYRIVGFTLLWWAFKVFSGAVTETCVMHLPLLAIEW